MKLSKFFIGALVLATGAACTVTRSASAYGGPGNQHGHVTVASLETALTPHGEFVFVQGYGRVWRPYSTPAGWQPYTHGHWVQDNDDWVWASDWSWGWAAFHYGRWAHDNRAGWVWVPGDTWGPAWVAWSYDDGYVGWAPLPPNAYWVNNGWSVGISSNRWYYVSRSNFGHRHLHRVKRHHHRGIRHARTHRRYPVHTSSARPARRVRDRRAPERRAAAVPNPTSPNRRTSARPAPRRARPSGAHRPVVTGKARKVEKKKERREAKKERSSQQKRGRSGRRARPAPERR